MEIRLLDAKDRSAFRALRLAALGSDPDSFMMTTEEERIVPKLMIEKYLDAPTPVSFFFGAFEASNLRGMVGSFGGSHAKRRHVAEILSLYVDPTSRRRGIGRRLLAAALDRVFAAPQIRRVKLSVVAGNDEALVLYRRFGFLECGREPDAYALGERSWDLIEMNLTKPATLLA